ncbi:hypothetical protein IFR05_014446 [Cadophora sp. M221]|nr:hypothetical protein IFR05_014446 [Cadophora sp. M221]
MEGPQEFHLFPQLPAELQLEVWKFATYQNCIGFRQVTKGRSEDLGIKPIGFGALRACQNSRKTALEVYGERVIALSTLQPYYSSIHYKQHLRSVVRFRPSQDTIYFPDLDDFMYVFWDWEISPGPNPMVRSGLSCIRSVAIGGFLESCYVWEDCPGGAKFGYVDDDYLIWDLDTTLTGLTGLEELILICPKPDDFNDFSDMTLDSWATENPPPPDAICHRLLSTDPAKTRVRTLRFLPIFTENMRSEMINNPWHRNDQKYFHGIYGRPEVPIVASKWWDNPVITVMTKEEFMARF